MKKNLCLWTVVLLGFIPLSVLQAQAIPDGTYEITAKISGLALAVQGTTSGSAVDQELYTGAMTQKWTVTNLGNNVVELVSAGTNEALEAPGATTVIGSDLDVSSYGGSGGQQWTIVPTGNGYYEIVNVNSGYEANVAGNSTVSGGLICQWWAGNYPNGVWAFTPVSPGTTGNYAQAFNYLTAASGTNSDAFNDHTWAGAFDSFVIGRYNIGGFAAGGDMSWIATDPLLEAGNGTSPSSLSDAFVLYKNGNAVFQGTVQVSPGGDIPMYSGH